MSSTFVGGRYRKHDGDRYLTGQVRYTADLVLPGMVHVAGHHVDHLFTDGRAGRDAEVLEHGRLSDHAPVAVTV